MKADIDSQFGYCPLKWVIHSGTMNKKNLNSIRERTLRMVYQDDTSYCQKGLLWYKVLNLFLTKNMR